jgi:dienelactone hydrolase
MTDRSDLSREMTAETPPGSGPQRPREEMPSAALTGRTLGHFEIEGLLGAGGFGEVYRARDMRLGRTVAIKVLPEALARDTERRERFRREAMAASALNHPNICTVHELVEEDGHHLIVMELVDGTTLHTTLAEGPLPVARVLAIALQIADALAEAHRAGILHRDIKGGNIALTRRGDVKVLDFGLAKRVDAAVAASQARTPDALTREGTTLGTLSYMSPEQLLGKPVDRRSDLFSFGVVLYEMLTGRLPFAGSTQIAIADAILHQPPLDIGGAPIPERLRALVKSLLEKDPARRPQSADVVLSELRAVQADETPRAGIRTRTVLVSAAVLAIAALALVGWAARKSSRARAVREKTIPEITRLLADDQYQKAAALVEEARHALPDDPQLLKLRNDATLGVSIASVPPGATISAKGLGPSATGSWEPIGVTPLVKIRVPKAFYLLRAELPGHLPAYRIWPTWNLKYAEGASLEMRLDATGSVPPDMVRIPGGKTVELAIPGLDHLPAAALDDFFIDRFEVTNAEYKRFVDAGGYRKKEVWKEPFLKDGRSLPFDEAMALLTDTTGRPGPAGWELGTFPKGQEQHPVSGVSWYEAAAFAEWAGKSLPTIYHWNRAAETRASMLIVPHSNFTGSGTVPVGGEGALSGYGTYDMAGNVKEWCWNESRGNRRFILGGGFGEPSYMFIDQDAQSPWDRRPNYGFRAVKLSGKAPDVTLARIEVAERDYAKEKPASDEAFRAYRSLYVYDKLPLNARVDGTETSDDWTRETVSFDAAYGGERVIAYLYLPKNGKPPLQTVVWFPGSGALHMDAYTMPNFSDFFVRSGRALVVPIYKSTYQRRDGLDSDYPEPTARWRDHMIAWAKDLGRTIDYLETRKEIDPAKIAYVGLSWGGAVAPVMLAVESRFRTGILLSGGLEFQKALPEADQINFVSRVKLPVLMLNGRYDHFFPVESSQLPLFRLLGTPEKEKKYVVYETGHAPPRKDVIRESLDWLDRYLGPVR